MLALDDLVGTILVALAMVAILAFLVLVSYFRGGHRGVPFEQALIELACVHGKLRQYLRLLTTGGIILLATTVLWGMGLADLVPEAVLDYGMSVLILAGVFTMLRLAWVAFNPVPLTETEREEVRQRLPEVTQSLWIAPAASRDDQRIGFRRYP